MCNAMQCKQPPSMQEPYKIGDTFFGYFQPKSTPWKKYRKSNCGQRYPYSFIHTISNGFYLFNIYPSSLLSHVREICFIFTSFVLFLCYSHKYGCKPAGKIILNFKLIVRFIIKTFIFAIILDCSQICWYVYINRLNRLDVISGGFIFFRV